MVQNSRSQKSRHSSFEARIISDISVVITGRTVVLKCVCCCAKDKRVVY